MRGWSVLIFLAACRGSDPPRTTPDATATTAPSGSGAIASPVVDAASVLATPPPGLACLCALAGGHATRDGSAWALVLGEGGPSIPWDDGNPKSPQERIASPDLEDMLATPYRTGPILPVTDEADDPGRVRLEPFFRAIYGASPAAVETALVPVTFAGHRVRFHRRAAPALERVATRLDAIVKKDPTLARFFKALGGTFAARPIAGTDRTSAHAWGIAIDIDTSASDYWRNATSGRPVWRNRIPSAIVDAFEAEHFVWGGRWFHYDTMHFEYRPELFDPACRRVASP